MRSRKAGSALALLLLAGPVVAQEREEPRTVTVSAMAEVERAPERAVVTLAVENQAETALAASQANARAMDGVIAALRRAGITGDAVRTTSYQLNPLYIPPRQGESTQRIAGYRAANMVEVRVDSLPRLGAVLDGAIGAGANRVASLSFELRDTETARLDAIEQAVRKAAREADVIARAAGQRLGPPLNIQSSSEVPIPPRPMYMGERVAMAAQVETPIEAGAITIRASVTITYRLDEP